MKKILLIALPLLAAFTAALTYKEVQDLRQPSQAKTQEKTTQVTAPEIQTPNNRSKPKTTKTPNNTSLQTLTPEMLTLTRIESPADRVEYLHAHLKTIPTNQLTDFYKTFHQAKNSHSENWRREQDVILHHWVSVDPTTALNYLKGKEGDSPAGAAFAIWMANNESAATAWYKSQDPESNPYSKLLERSALQIGKNHRPLLNQILSLTDKPRTKEFLARDIAFRIFNNEGTAALKWIETIEDPKLRQKIGTTFVNAKAEVAPEEILNWAATKPLESNQDIIGNALHALNEKNPDKAHDWFIKQDYTTQKEVASYYLDDLYKNSPDLTEKIVQDLGNQPRDEHVRIRYAKLIYKQNPNAATALLTKASQSADEDVAKRASETLQNLNL